MNCEEAEELAKEQLAAAGKSAKIERLRKLIEEDEEILKHVRCSRRACLSRVLNLSNDVRNHGGTARDAVDCLIYHMAERELLDLEYLIQKELREAEDELKKLVGCDHGEA